MKRVYTSKDRVAIEIVRDLLANRGIESKVFNEATASVLGDVPFFLASPEVWVLHDEHEADARGIVASFESGAVTAALKGDPWACSQCGEAMEGQFSACWKCDVSDSEYDLENDPDATCGQCGYLLRGLPTPRCPECGTEF